MDTSKLFRVDGMIAVVTGGGSGIGETMALALAGSGARRVYILGRRAQALRATAAKASEGVLRPLVCDVTSKESLQGAVDAIAAESGHINLLVANAGVLGPAGRFSPDASLAETRRALFADASMGDFTGALECNVTGAYFTMAAFLELLGAGNEAAVRSNDAFGAPKLPEGTAPLIPSQVVFTSSISAYSRNKSSAPAYSGGKAAIAHLAKHACTNLARFGIRVNVLAPGLFPSELAQGLIGDRDPEKEDYTDPRWIPSRRFGGDEEMAGTILYLASRAGSFCNGLVLVTDGGRLAVMESEY